MIINSTGNPIRTITWGGANTDKALDIVVDDSGYIYICGETSSWGAGGSDILIAKFNFNGNKIWNITWGGPNNDYGTGIAMDSSGNIYVCGYQVENGTGAFDVVLLKYTSDGVKLAEKIWGKSGTSDSASDIVIDSNNYVYITGNTNSYGEGNNDVLIMKFNYTLSIIWNTTWGTSSLDNGIGITIGSNGYIHVSGNTDSSEYSSGLKDFIVLLVDPDSSDVKNIYSWGDASDQFGRKLTTSQSGKVYICGYTTVWGTSDNDFQILALNINTGTTGAALAQPFVPGFEILYIFIVFMIIIPVYIILKQKNKTIIV